MKGPAAAAVHSVGMDMALQGSKWRTSLVYVSGVYFFMDKGLKGGQGFSGSRT